MKKTKIIIALMLILAMFCLTACGAKEEQSNVDENGDFVFASGIDENGYWDGVKALDLVELGDYENIEVNTSEINEQIAYFKQMYPDSKLIYEGTAEAGDTIQIDFTGYIDGEAFDGGSGTDYELTLGDGNMIPGFEDGIIGMEVGEQKMIDATFPEAYGVDELNGKNAQFDITLKCIVESTDPEINDAFVLSNLYKEYGWSTVEEMNDGIKAQLALNSLKEASNVKEVPESIINYQTEALVSYYKQYATAYGMDFASFLTTYIGVEDEAGLREQSLEYCTEEAEYYLYVQAIAEEFGIVPTEDDVKAYYEQNYKDNGQFTYEEFSEQFGMNYLKNAVLPVLVQKKMIEIVK